MIGFKWSACFCGAVFAASSVCAQDLVWSIEGLAGLESAYFDGGTETLFVSNVNGEPGGKDGNGYISKVSTDGQMIEAEWVTGLDAPKGLVSDGVTLYVSDIDRLVAIDIASGEVTGTWVAEGAIFLNDTAIDSAGNVYVSDMIAQKIHVLSEGALSTLAEGDMLQHPNGLNMRDGNLVVAPWGVGLQKNFTTTTGGHLLIVDTSTGAVATLGSGAPVGNLDGIEPDGQGNWIVSDWIAGAVYRIAEDGTAEMLLDLDLGSADLEYLPEQSMVIVPMMMNNSLVAYQLD